MTSRSEEIVAVVGLGYVGCPIAMALAASRPVIGYDIDAERIAELKRGHDRTGEVDEATLASPNLHLTTDPDDLRRASVHVVTVPTPIDGNRQPELRHLLAATRTIAAALSEGDLVVYETTGYPGLTEEVCAPELSRISGLPWPGGFHLAYSPERINPGDREHRIDTITKVISAESGEALERVHALYAPIVPAVHRAPSIRVAEAAKVLENTQRDLNIALMNELAMICDRLDIRTADVLGAARTKWNFLPFTPGLVGGHCIGVDPYYLTSKAEAVGHHPQVILAGRRINDEMGRFVARRTMMLLAERGLAGSPRVGVAGLAFKENVPDARNSRVPELVAELQAFGAEVVVHDPLVDARDAEREHGIALAGEGALRELDALVLAVPHASYRQRGAALFDAVRERGVFIDVRSVFEPSKVRPDLRYWSL
ncbi:MAG: nucleotide sugar dehydrogenase [Myxococcota bacterium]